MAQQRSHLSSTWIAVSVLFTCWSSVQCQICTPLDNGTCGNLSTCNSLSVCRCVDGAYSTNPSSNFNCQNSSIPDPSCSLSQCIFCPADNSFCGRCRDDLLLYTSPDGTSQTCYEECPSGTSQEVNAYNGVQRRICAGAITSTGNSIDQTILIAAVCVIVGVLLLMVLAFTLYCTISYVRNKRSRGFEVQDSAEGGAEVQQNAGFRSGSISGKNAKDPSTTVTTGGNRQSMVFEDADYMMFSQSSHSDEMVEFLTKLNTLRKHSTDFLRMLNDMRRRLKELPGESSAAKSYRNVMGDITRLLFLLNKKPGNIEMPPDGMQLLEWSEQTLEHYLESQKRAVARKKQQEHSEHSSSPSANPRLSSYGGQAETHF